MKKTLLSLLLISLQFKVLALSDATVKLEDINKKKNTPIEDVKKTDDTFEKMLSVPEIKAQYDKCKNKFKDNSKDLSDISNCVWKGLDPDTQKKVTQFYEEESKGKNKPVPAGENKPKNNEDTGLGFRSANIKLDYQNSEGYKKLSDILGKKLREALYGDEEKLKQERKIASVDHKSFNDIYRSQLSKTIIDAFASYCLEVNLEDMDNANPSCLTEKKCKEISSAKEKESCEKDCQYFSYDEDKAEENRIKNLKRVENGDFNIENSSYGLCIKSVGMACKYGKQDKACVLTDYVTSSKRNLMLAEKIDKDFYGKLNNGVQMAIKNQADQKDYNAFKAITVTSNEIESAYKDENKKLADEANDCANSPDKKCEKFLSTDTENNRDSVVEYALRQHALEAKLDESLSSIDGVKKFLKSQGLSDSEIEKKLSGNVDLEKIKEDIKMRFVNERESIVKELSKKVMGNTSEKDGNIDQADSYKLSSIKQELSSKTDRFKDLTRFNNIVGAYLSTKNEDGSDGGRNTASLFEEINSGKNESNQSLKDQASKAGLQDSKGKGSELFKFKIDDINKMLGF